MKKLLSLCLLALMFVSCSKDNDTDVQTKSEKKVRIEVEFSGSYQNYQLLFTVNSLTKGEGKFVEPLITTPTNTQWTQVISQGNAYNYIADLTSNKLVVESKEAVNRLGFLLSATLDIPEQSTPRFRYKVRHPFRSKVRQHSAGKGTDYSAAKYATSLEETMLVAV